MRFVIFTHSLVSDWNNGNAHFLRGLATELVEQGHSVRILEPRYGWSRTNLLAFHGHEAVTAFEEAYPAIRSELYDLHTLDLRSVLQDASVVLVHEWNEASLIRAIGHHRRVFGNYRLFFHDTHHRSLTHQETIASLDLTNYDGVLAYGDVIRRRYLDENWATAAWTFHEAADTRIFRPLDRPKDADVVWIGNWGDGERTQEIRDFFIKPVARLGLKARAYGVRYPNDALKELADAGIEYGGWLPNHQVPEVFARHRVTLHIPRRPYATALPGIPTIRPFEAMSCGIPLICAPWRDTEGLFRSGQDYLTAETTAEMCVRLQMVLNSTHLRVSLAASGLQRIREQHTCAHRVDQWLRIATSLEGVAEGQVA